MKTWKVILHSCILILTCIIAGFISANTIAKPVILTPEEINHYTNTAETVWYEGLDSVKEYDEIEIKSDLGKQKIHIVPYNTNKQSVTVNFSNPTKAVVTVNDPVVSYWGCFLFYGFFFGGMAYVLLSIPVVLIKEKFFKKSIY